MINRELIGISKWIRDELTANLDRAAVKAKFKRSGLKCNEETFNRTLRRVYNQLTGTVNTKLKSCNLTTPNLYNKESIDGNILVIGDPHEPWCHPDYLGFCKRVYDEYDCKLAVIIGDLIDQHAISYHETNPDGVSAGDEHQLAYDNVQRWIKTFPNVRVCIGNHDALPLRKARTHGLPTSLFKTYGELWGTPKEWLWRFTHEINGVLFQHGTNCSGQQAHINQARKNRQSTVIGHCHTLLGVEYDASKRDIIFGLSTGCGLSVSKYAFEYAKEDPKRPILGCGVVVNNGKHAIAIPMEM